MDGQRQLLGLIQLLYAAPGSTEGWRAFLDELCVAVDGTAASFISHDLQTCEADISLIVRGDPKLIQEYATYWGQHDPWVHSPEAPKKLTTGVVDTGELLIRRDDLRRTAYYNDFACRYDVTQALAGMIEAGPSRLSFLSVNRPDSRPLFGDIEVALLRALMPHLQQAVQIHRRLGAAELMAEHTQGALNRLSQGVLIVSANGKVIWQNRVAESILKQRDGLISEQGELRASTPTLTNSLRSAIYQAVQLNDGHTIAACKTVILAKPSGGRPLSVIAAPVARKQTLFGIGCAAAALFVSDPERPPLVSPEFIKQVLPPLTNSEARLVSELVAGYSLKEGADRLGIQLETARKRLKVIFEKTDVHRQSGLVQRVLTVTSSLL